MDSEFPLSTAPRLSEAASYPWCGFAVAQGCGTVQRPFTSSEDVRANVPQRSFPSKHHQPQQPSTAHFLPSVIDTYAHPQPANGSRLAHRSSDNGHTNDYAPNTFPNQAPGPLPNPSWPPQQAHGCAAPFQPTSVARLASYPGRANGFESAPVIDTFGPSGPHVPSGFMSPFGSTNVSVRPRYNGAYGSMRLGPNASMGPLGPDMDPYLRGLLDGATYALGRQSRDDGPASEDKGAPAQQSSRLPSRSQPLPPRPVTEPMDTSAASSGLSTQGLSAKSPDKVNGEDGLTSHASKWATPIQATAISVSSEETEQQSEHQLGSLLRNVTQPGSAELEVVPPADSSDPGAPARASSPNRNHTGDNVPESRLGDAPYVPYASMSAEERKPRRRQRPRGGRSVRERQARLAAQRHAHIAQVTQAARVAQAAARGYAPLSMSAPYHAMTAPSMLGTSRETVRGSAARTEQRVGTPWQAPVSYDG